MVSTSTPIRLKKTFTLKSSFCIVTGSASSDQSRAESLSKERSRFLDGARFVSWKRHLSVFVSTDFATLAFAHVLPIPAFFSSLYLIPTSLRPERTSFTKLPSQLLDEKHINLSSFDPVRLISTSQIKSKSCSGLLSIVDVSLLLLAIIM